MRGTNRYREQLTGTPGLQLLLQEGNLPIQATLAAHGLIDLPDGVENGSVLAVKTAGDGLQCQIRIIAG